MFSEFVQWQNYIATEFAQCEVEEEGADRLVRRIDAESLFLANPEKGTVKKTMAGIKLDTRVQKAYDDQLAAYAKRKMTQVLFTNCERSAALLSRELSRRIGSSDVQRRQMRWQP